MDRVGFSESTGVWQQGAFYATTEIKLPTNYASQYSLDTDKEHPKTFFIDASLFNSVYTNGDILRPKSLSVLALIRI